MSKYAALGNYLSRQKTGRVRMSFSEIEMITGGKLPASQRYPAWWSNNPQNNPMTRIWLDAGFQTEQVDIVARKLVFRKVESGADVKARRTVDASKNEQSDDHPLFLRLRGTGSIPDGVDVTAPADPDWGALAYGDDLIGRRF